MEQSPRKSNKIADIVLLKQILRKWRKHSTANSTPSSPTSTSPSKISRNRSFDFIKRTLSFSDTSFADSDFVPKGSLAVCVGKELKRYVIPTEYLGHQAFAVLLREAEDEFGFGQEGVLKIPCDVAVFDRILEIVERKKTFPCDVYFLPELEAAGEPEAILGTRCSPDPCDVAPFQPQPFVR